MPSKGPRGRLELGKDRKPSKTAKVLQDVLMVRRPWLKDTENREATGQGASKGDRAGATAVGEIGLRREAGTQAQEHPGPPRETRGPERG